MKIFDVQDEFQGSYTARLTNPKFLVVHHAAALYSQATGIEDVRVVARYHTRDRGWPGIGYHWALAEEMQGGEIALYKLSRLDLQRAHVALRNHEGIGISCLTNFDQHPNGLPGEKWIAALVEALKSLKAIYPNTRIVGHQEVALPGYETACPGRRWRDWRADLIARVEGEAVKTLETFVPPRRYRITASGGNVRLAPSIATGKVSATLPKDSVLPIAGIVEGDAVGANQRWASIAGVTGYIHTSILEEEKAALSAPVKEQIEQARKAAQQVLDSLKSVT